MNAWDFITTSQMMMGTYTASRRSSTSALSAPTKCRIHCTTNSDAQEPEPDAPNSARSNASGRVSVAKWNPNMAQKLLELPNVVSNRKTKDLAFVASYLKLEPRSVGLTGKGTSCVLLIKTFLTFYTISMFRKGRIQKRQKHVTPVSQLRWIPYL